MARIGIVAPMFGRGQSYVSLTLARAMQSLGHDIYWFVHEGMVYGNPQRETTGEWASWNRTDYPAYDIAPLALLQWASYHTLAAVVLNECLAHELPMVLQKGGIRTIEYIDAYLSAHTRPYLRFRDQLWCVTRRSERILQEWGKGDKTHWIGWGVPETQFAPIDSLGVEHGYDFMTSQGWLGNGCRKGLDTLLWALEHQPSDGTPPEVLVHCQLAQEEALTVMGWTRPLPPHIVWESRDHPPPGLYHLGRVVVQPSKIEGFGLSIVEAMCAGRPVITTDEPPMNEFMDVAGGWLVSPERYQPHVDGSCYRQALMSPAALWKTMQEAQSASDAMIAEKAHATLMRAHDLFNWPAFTQRIAGGLDTLGIGSRNGS